MKTKKDVLIYISGYIDGDGCFRTSVYTQKNGCVVYERSITISSVKKEPLDLFKKYFGGFFTKQKKGNNRKLLHTWTIKGNKSKDFAKLILPYLVVKKEQCFTFIDYCNSIEPNKFKNVTVDTLEKRNFLIKKIRKLIHESEIIDIAIIRDIKKGKKIVEPTKDDFLYLSGIIDSEGCFRISHRFRKSTGNKIYNTVLDIGNKKSSITRWLYERFGGAITFRKTACLSVWSSYSKSLYPILLNVYPYLINKKEVCNELIEFQKTIFKNGGKKISIEFKEEFKEVCRKRELIIEKVHKLNKKGL